MKRVLFVILALVVMLQACEKDTINIPELGRPDVGVSSESQLRDSVYLYTYYFYLWQDRLPTSFATYQHRNAESVLEALKVYATDPLGNPYDRFSFLDRQGMINQEIQQGQVGSFGFEVRYINEEDLYVKKVHEGSPAYAAGIRRGWKLIEINGILNLSVENLEQDGFAALFNALNGDHIQLRLITPEGQIKAVQLNKTLYHLKPILANKIWDTGAEKIGYFAFDSFLSLNLIRTPLDQLINQFAAEGVKNLIVDLRYNGGGDVSTATHISSLLAPAASHGKLMSRYLINDLLKMEGWDLFLFGPEYFNKQNTLELDRIYFLVTGGTASASELLINNLYPHMDVVLVGDSRTYGKPVGYFGWDIMDADLYAVSFQTLNSLGEGDYFNGFAVDKLVYDDVSRDFGDPLEAMTAQAIHHITHGSFPSGTTLEMSNKRTNTGRQTQQFGQTGRLNEALDAKHFKAMFDFRKAPLVK